MLNIPAAIIPDLNSLTNDFPVIVLCEIQLPNNPLIIRLAQNTEDVKWDGETWTRFPFEIDNMSEGRAGEIPQINLKIGNQQRALQGFIEDEDGGVDSTVFIRVVHLKHLAETTPIIILEYIVTNVVADSNFITFSLGAANIFNRRFPLNRIMKNFCRFRFKSLECGYVGTETVCNKTVQRCRELFISPRFGGFPGVGVAALKI